MPRGSAMEAIEMTATDGRAIVRFFFWQQFVWFRVSTLSQPQDRSPGHSLNEAFSKAQTNPPFGRDRSGLIRADKSSRDYEHGWSSIFGYLPSITPAWAVCRIVRIHVARCFDCWQCSFLALGGGVFHRIYSQQVAPVSHPHSCSQRSASLTVRFANWMYKTSPRTSQVLLSNLKPPSIPIPSTPHSRRGNHNRIEKRSEVVPLADRHPKRAEDCVRRLQMKIEVGNPVREGRLLGRELDADGWSERSVFLLIISKQTNAIEKSEGQRGGGLEAKQKRQNKRQEKRT
jgi:hypothetical protein